MFEAIPDDWESLFEPEAGFLLVEKCVRLYLQQALKLGATLKAQEKVLSWREMTSENDLSLDENKVEIITDKNTYKAKKVIFTAGAWTDKLLQDLKVPLKVTRQILGWVKPDKWG